MVISTIALLTYLLADFTFETQINQIKAYNAQDQIQARLTAEAGLNFSLAKLKIYQETRNKLANNETLQKTISDSDLDKILTTPFIYPIPIDPKMGMIQKNAINDFQKGTVIKGNLSIYINKVSGFLNPNNLRIVKETTTDNEEDDNTSSSNNNEEDEENSTESKTPSEITEEKILQMFESLFTDLREESDYFNLHYSNLDPEILVKELKYFVNNKGAIDDPMFPEIESKYLDADMEAKHAPMTSIDEFFLLAGWPEYITNKVIDKFTVHEVGTISLNELTIDTLKLIFPDITDLQVEEFFRYRDGDEELGEDPHPFKGVEDFKNVIVNQLGVVSSTKFDEREAEFKAANLSFGVAGKLFKIESTGEYNTSKVILTAYVDLPIKPQSEKTTTKKDDQTNQNETDQNQTQDQDQDQDQDQNEETKNEEEATKTEYMTPRIIEIRVD